MIKKWGIIMTFSKEDYKHLPEIADIENEQPIFWKNLEYNHQADLRFSLADIFDADARWQRFAPFIAKVFPETKADKGVIESPLIRIDEFQKKWNDEMDEALQVKGSLFLKADNLLPITGSIKSRGGIYEVLKFAEHIAMTKGDLTYRDNYAVLAEEKFMNIFAKYKVAVGSTGNLGLSVGIAAASFGFRTTVYMSHDAKDWKKDKLRANGVEVVEYDSDFSHAITEGRKCAQADPNTYFVDDESSTDLFLGYSVAALGIQKQLKDHNIVVDDKHPLVVYLPAGVGGSPSGVSFGLKQLFGDHVYPVFCEPTHVPSVTLGLITKQNSRICVEDFGLDGLTAADGLAVSRPSKIAGPIMRTLLFASATFEDKDIYRYLVRLEDTEHISVEPSATAGFCGLKALIANEVAMNTPKTTHIVWATGGSLMPDNEKIHNYQYGKTLG
ncbi:D-serine ammonia-lyase [Holzapfeliella sp. He02]|uniref:Probable D-serine dehydratase n=2 Tax=Holzapfeliella saturejae TaxID=3082953 RepID=A0ABU8SHM7_9LACO